MDPSRNTFLHFTDPESMRMGSYLPTIRSPWEIGLGRKYPKYVI